MTPAVMLCKLGVPKQHKGTLLSDVYIRMDPYVLEASCLDVQLHDLEVP
jgi:hypothetical protein